MERCAPRDDTRLSRVVVDLLGGVPADGDLWVSATVERGGKQIELVSAVMLGQGPDGTPRPVAKASGWRFQTLDTAALASTSAPPLPPANRTASTATWPTSSTVTTFTARSGCG